MHINSNIKRKFIFVWCTSYVLDVNLNAHFSLGLFRANETNYSNKLYRLRILNGRKQPSWPCTSTAVELSQTLLRTTPVGGQSRTQTWKHWISGMVPKPLSHTVSSYVKVSKTKCCQYFPQKSASDLNLNGLFVMSHCFINWLL